jgi:hypothetical protein
VYVSGSSYGRLSAHWKTLADRLKDVAGRTSLPKLRTWAVDASRRLRRMAERERRSEEEEDLRTE